MAEVRERTGLRLAGVELPLLDRARIYSCGITPYDVTHLGHAATFVWVDVLGRVLAQEGVEPVLCRNITDVDDVLSAAAARAGEPYDSFASVQKFYFDRDVAALNLQPPRFEPSARRHIDHVVSLATALLDAGAAYAVAGNVFFRGAAVASAAGLTRAEALTAAAAGGEEAADPAKQDGLDVPLWRASAAGEPGWPSPWGPGRPGWHAGCAAMALSSLGPAIDVLCGGSDLAYPHHAFQAAIAEALTGTTPFARATFRVGEVSVDGAKMAKSTGNLVLVRSVLADFPAAALRLHLIDRPWALGWEHDDAGLAAAAGRLEKLYLAAGRAGDRDDGSATRVRAALLDDLDVPAALAVAEEAGGQTMRTLIGVLGLDH